LAGGIGHFSIKKRLGQGRAANVMLAHNERDGRDSALKILLPALAAEPDTAQRFIAAGRAMASLEHPSLAAVYDAGTTGPTNYIETEYLDGWRLRDAILETGPMDPNFCVQTARQLAAALNFAMNNSGGGVHGGLSTRNIFLCGRGNRVNVPVMTDFGLAPALLPEGEQPESFPFSIECAAPELLRGGAAGPAADVYSIGAILYEMLDGAPVFTAPADADLLQMHLEEKPVPLSEADPGIPPALEKLVMKCLEKDPSARPQSPAAMLKMLGDPELLRQLSSAPRRAVPRPQPAPVQERQQPAPKKPAVTEAQQPSAQEIIDYTLEKAPAEPAPYLHVEPLKVNLYAREPAGITVYNHGTGTLTGRAHPGARWLKVDPREFTLEQDESAELYAWAGHLPPEASRAAVLQLSSDGGDEQVEIEVDENSIRSRAAVLGTGAAALAAALAGGYFIWGLENAPDTGLTPLYILAGFVVFLLASVFRQDRGPAVAGLAGVIFCTWWMLELEAKPVEFAAAAAANLFPLAVVFAVSRPLFRKIPSAGLLSFMIPVLLWVLCQAGAGIVLHNDEGTLLAGRAPLAGFERRTVYSPASNYEPSQPAIPPENETNMLPSRFIEVTVSGANIRSGAGMGHGKIFTADEGDKFPLAGDKDGWYKIQLPDGRTGWISKKISREKKLAPPGQ